MSEPSVEAPEYPAGARALATYTVDDHDAEVSLPGYLAAVPSIVRSGDQFTFDAQHAAELDGQPEFEVEGILDLTDEDDRAIRDEVEQLVTATVVPAELRQADELAAERDPANLKGDALDDAARAAGVSTSLSADEKRAALADLGPVVSGHADPPPLAAAPAGEPTDPQE